MKTTFQLFILFCFGLLMVNTNASAIYIPVSLTGFNADVVADVQGNAMGSTNNDVDGVNYVFMTQSYNPLGSSYMPINGVVNSVVATTPGLTFQLASYTANNSLRLSGTTTGSLSLLVPQAAQTVFVLGATGSGTSTATITITFTDLTTQVFSSQVTPDWYNGANFAIQGLGRTNRNTNTIENSTTNPRLYQTKLDILPANYGKTIQSVTFDNTGAVLNIMAISIDSPPMPYDPAVTNITSPGGNCFTASQILTAQVCNYGMNSIDLSVNPITVTLNVNGPNGLNQYVATLNSGTLPGLGATCVNALFMGVNLYAGGTYYINTNLSLSGLTNAYLSNDSLSSPVVKINYRPTPGPTYELCQYGSIPFGQGLTVSGCSAPILGVDSVMFTIMPGVIDNVGATGTGTALGSPANCSNQYAGLLGTATLPTLPAGAYFTQNATLEVTNMSSTYWTEARFILYGSAPIGTDLYAGCPTGYNTGAGNPAIGGLSVGSTSLFYNTRTITPAQMSAIYGGNGTLNLGYWETWNDLPATSDVNFNVGGATTAKLKFYYAYVPAGFNWYTVPSGPNPSLYNSSPFNPLVTTGSGLSNSNTPGTYTFYAACTSSPTCRVPVQLQIHPTPQAIQDTLAKCEYAVSSNAAIFDLTTMNAAVSNNNIAASVEYYLDEPLFSQVPFPLDDTSSTNFIYSKVFYPATGCFAKDSLLLQVNSLPEFPSPVLTGFACAPNAIDVKNLIDPLSTSPAGTDTLYYSDPAFTIPHPNPTSITAADTVYMVFATNTNPVCSDTAIAYVDIIPANNYISGQVLTPSIYSNAGSYSCMSTTLADGMSDTIRSTTDCRRVAAVTDITNGTSLGTVSACLDIAPSTPFYNGQPYVNRAYTITPTTNDTGYVCLYYLDQDFQDYNADAFNLGWPMLPTAATMPSNMQNLAVTKVSGGALGTVGSVPTAIPNSSVNASYDPATSVWTICVPAEGFSQFYVHAQNPGNAPLPVTLLSFTGHSVNGTSDLNWITSMERNNSHFVVERSRDGKNYSRLSDNIASKAPNGNSDLALSYGYVDTKPFEGYNYYRLKQHDVDGKMTYSNVVNVYFGNETMVTLYPNPVSSLLNVDINTPKATTAQVKITDATGRVVRVTDMTLQAGSNQTQVDLHSLADGVYMVNITNGKGLNYSQPVRKN
jgi:hypothetical protein